jgi:drug/metabolite transporter (DMT)-like permease
MRSMAATETPPSSRPLAGVLWMLLTGVCFVAVTAIVKHVGDRIPPAESAFLRYLLGLILMVPILRRAFTYRIDRGAMRLFALRGAAHGIGVMLWFYAMTQISIAEVTAMNYLSPVYVTIGAALFLGERLALRRIAAIVLALVGALVILRPGLRELSPGHLAMLGTAIVFAASYLIAKIMADRLPPEVVVGWLSLTVTIVLAPFAALDWVWPTWTELGWLTLVAFFATAGHYTMTLALRAAPITVTQPVTYLQLVWATLLGLLVFGEAIDGWVLLGGTMILAAVSFITWREAVLRRRAVTPPAPATKL